MLSSRGTRRCVATSGITEKNTLGKLCQSEPQLRPLTLQHHHLIMILLVLTFLILETFLMVFNLDVLELLEYIFPKEYLSTLLRH